MQKPNLLSPAIVIALVIGVSCSEQPVTVQNDTANNQAASTSAGARSEQTTPFNTTVGAPIDYAQGQRWIDNYDSAGTSGSKTYTLKGSALNSILVNSSCVGLSLVYGVDLQKRLHILPLGIDTKGRWIKSKYVYTQNGDITWQTAQCWIKNYTGPVQSHFFGQNTFSRLWNNGKTKADVLVSFAKDDNNNPQLLLTAPSVRSNGKSAATTQFEDASSPCPPVCPK